MDETSTELVSERETKRGLGSWTVRQLYTLAPGARLGWAIEDLSAELTVLFGRRVDLVARRALDERLVGPVLAEAQPLYAAA